MEINRIPGDTEARWKSFVQKWNSPEFQSDLERLFQQHEAEKKEFEKMWAGDRW